MCSVKRARYSRLESISSQKRSWLISEQAWTITYTLVVMRRTKIITNNLNFFAMAADYCALYTVITDFVRYYPGIPASRSQSDRLLSSSWTNIWGAPGQIITELDTFNCFLEVAILQGLFSWFSQRNNWHFAYLTIRYLSVEATITVVIFVHRQTDRHKERKKER